MQGYHQRQYIIQAPRKKPPKEACKFDLKNRQWIKAKLYKGSFTQWEHSEFDYFVWFKKDQAPEEDEFVSS